MEVYLDNSATTKCFDSAKDMMVTVLTKDYGNPSSMHLKGVQGEEYIKYTKEVIAKVLKVNEKEIYFTSGGTEADNLALIGAAMANRRMGMHLITTSIEHPAILQTMAHLEKQGFHVTYLPVDKNGRVCLKDLQNAITRETILISMMQVNNEIGAIEPIEEAAALIKRINPKIIFHVDAVQGFGKVKLLPKRAGVDMLSVSGHKIHGPKGIGFLYVNENVKIWPTMFGGGQQKGIRPGTENVPAIAGLGKATETLFQDFEKDVAHLYDIKEMFVEALSTFADVSINGLTGIDSAPHIVSVSVKGVRSEVLLHALEDRGVYVSAGSACASNKPMPSATLKAIGIEKELLDCTIRFSFSVFTTEEEIKYAIMALQELLPMLRRYTRH